MSNWQNDVHAFHETFGLTISDEPALRDHKLRAALIREEADETIAAIERGDLVEAVDGVIDLIYVALGSLVSWGIESTPFWDEVHRSNMAKAGGAIDERGKLCKPSGWLPPDIASLLIAQGWVPPTVERAS